MLMPAQAARISSAFRQGRTANYHLETRQIDARLGGGVEQHLRMVGTPWVEGNAFALDQLDSIAGS